jgi:hypothetical protein
VVLTIVSLVYAVSLVLLFLWLGVSSLVLVVIVVVMTPIIYLICRSVQHFTSTSGFIKCWSDWRHVDFQRFRNDYSGNHEVAGRTYQEAHGSASSMYPSVYIYIGSHTDKAAH